MATEIVILPHPGDAATHPTLTPDLLPADREGAYQRWAYLDGQNAAATARALGLSENTVRSWATRDGWRARVEQERSEQTQRVRSVAELALMRVVPRVIDRLHRIAMGQGDVKPVLTKDGELVEVERPIPAQAQVNAANSLLDRFGLTAVKLHQHQVTAPVPSPPPPAPTPPPTTSTTAYDPDNPDPTIPITRDQALALTPAQRLAYEQAMRVLIS